MGVNGSLDRLLLVGLESVCPRDAATEAEFVIDTAAVTFSVIFKLVDEPAANDGIDHLMVVGVGLVVNAPPLSDT